MSIEMKQIGQRLRERRKAEGITQATVADSLGIHRPASSEIEAGRRKVTAWELMKLAELYHVSMDWVMDVQTCKQDSGEECWVLYVRYPCPARTELLLVTKRSYLAMLFYRQVSERLARRQGVEVTLAQMVFDDTTRLKELVQWETE